MKDLNSVVQSMVNAEMGISSSATRVPIPIGLAVSPIRKAAPVFPAVAKPGSRKHA